jgi:hypothetical protein
VGVRVGGCTLLDETVGSDIGCRVSGHAEDRQGVGKFPSYPVIDYSTMLPGACVLHDWPAPPIRGHGPAPASLQPLLAMGVTPEKLDVLADEFFFLVPGASYPRFM